MNYELYFWVAILYSIIFSAITTQIVTSLQLRRFLKEMHEQNIKFAEEVKKITIKNLKDFYK
jgi:hypothetical protein